MSNQTNRNRWLQCARWVRRRFRSMGSGLFFEKTDETVRTVEIIECQERTMLLVPVQGADADACPLCGSPLMAHREDPARPQLPPQKQG